MIPPNEVTRIRQPRIRQQVYRYSRTNKIASLPRPALRASTAKRSYTPLFFVFGDLFDDSASPILSHTPRGLDDCFLRGDVDAVRARQGVDERQVANGGKVLLGFRRFMQSEGGNRVTKIKTKITIKIKTKRFAVSLAWTRGKRQSVRARICLTTGLHTGGKRGCLSKGMHHSNKIWMLCAATWLPPTLPPPARHAIPTMHAPRRPVKPIIQVFDASGHTRGP